MCGDMEMSILDVDMFREKWLKDTHKRDNFTFIWGGTERLDDYRKD